MKKISLIFLLIIFLTNLGFAHELNSIPAAEMKVKGYKGLESKLPVVNNLIGTWVRIGGSYDGAGVVSPTAFFAEKIVFLRDVSNSKKINLIRYSGQQTATIFDVSFGEINETFGNINHSEDLHGHVKKVGSDDYEKVSFNGSGSGTFKNCRSIGDVYLVCQTYLKNDDVGEWPFNEVFAKVLPPQPVIK